MRSTFHYPKHFELFFQPVFDCFVLLWLYLSRLDDLRQYGSGTFGIGNQNDSGHFLFARCFCQAEPVDCDKKPDEESGPIPPNIPQRIFFRR